VSIISEHELVAFHVNRNIIFPVWHEPANFIRNIKFSLFHLLQGEAFCLISHFGLHRISHAATNLTLQILDLPDCPALW